MNHKKGSLSIYIKLKVEDSLARNLFSRSNMDYCMVEVTLSEGYENAEYVSL
jgi:hypothetical protein